jgi:hypothetical protein
VRHRKTLSLAWQHPLLSESRNRLHQAAGTAQSGRPSGKALLLRQLKETWAQQNTPIQELISGIEPLLSGKHNTLSWVSRCFQLNGCAYYYKECSRSSASPAYCWELPGGSLIGLADIAWLFPQIRKALAGTADWGGQVDSPITTFCRVSTGKNFIERNGHLQCWDRT